MMQTGGLAILFAWLIFAALLTVLAVIVLRHPADVVRESRRRAGSPPDEAGADRMIYHDDEAGRAK